MKTILLAGASGMVGREVLRQALADPRIGEVVAPTRRPLAASPGLRNVLVDFDALPADAEWWKVDAVVCTLGTTIRDAGSQAAFRKVDHDYPLAVARHALADRPWQAATCLRLQADSERLAVLLAPLGTVRRTALFCTLSVSDDGLALFEHFARRAILLRRFAAHGLLRFGLPGSEAEWQRLGAAICAWSA